jgi:hypothetical protein
VGSLTAAWITTLSLMPSASSQRPWPVPVLPQLVYGGPFLSRCAPGFPVDSRRPSASISSHPSHGQRFAAEGVCQQALQGLHPAPPAFFRCLHDTHLETAHVLVYLVPVDPVPAIFSV